jgi:4'-phosphopantetheinyl transferase
VLSLLELRSRATLSRLMNNKIDMFSASVWLLDGNLVHEDDIGFFEQQLGATEIVRYTGFKRRERKRQFLLGRMLLRFTVSNLLSLRPDALGVVERTGHAPLLVLPDSQRLQPSFSLSHSREWVACVVSFRIHLGIDIEVRDPTRNVLGISEFVFHPNEHRWLLPQVEAARLSAFYQLWCTREALYKLMSNSGHEKVLSPLVAANGAFALQGHGWHRYTVPHSLLTVVVCTDRPLVAIHKIELTGLSRESGWQQTESSIN